MSGKGNNPPTSWSIPLLLPGLLQDKRMEMDKHGLGVGDYNRVVGKGPGSRPQISKESSMDRGPYFDKVSGCRTAGLLLFSD